MIYDCSTAVDNSIYTAGCALMLFDTGGFKALGSGVLPVILILFSLFILSPGSPVVLADSMPSNWQETARSLAENNTQYRMTKSIISGLDELIGRNDQGRIMLYFGMIEDFHKKAESNPEKFEPENNLRETLELLEQLNQEYMTKDSFELKETGKDFETPKSLLKELREGELSQSIDLAELYLELQEYKYQENLKTLAKLTSENNSVRSRGFYELAGKLTLHLEDERRAEELKDKETVKLFESIIEQELRADVKQEEIEKTIRMLLDNAGKYSESGSKLDENIEEFKSRFK